MTIFSLCRLCSAHLISNPPTVTATSIERLEVFIITMYFVWCSELPFVVFAVEIVGIDSLERILFSMLLRKKHPAKTFLHALFIYDRGKSATESGTERFGYT
jgi:hypothetical protein